MVMSIERLMNAIEYWQSEKEKAKKENNKDEENRCQKAIDNLEHKLYNRHIVNLDED